MASSLEKYVSDNSLRVSVLGIGMNGPRSNFLFLVLQYCGSQYD